MKMRELNFNFKQKPIKRIILIIKYYLYHRIRNKNKEFCCVKTSNKKEKERII